MLFKRRLKKRLKFITLLSVYNRRFNQNLIPILFDIKCVYSNHILKFKLETLVRYWKALENMEHLLHKSSTPVSGYPDFETQNFMIFYREALISGCLDSALKIRILNHKNPNSEAKIKISKGYVPML